MLPLPITAMYLALLALVYIILALQVVRLRRLEGVSLGDGGNAVLRSAIRAHAHFAEYVPIIILMAALLENVGLPAVKLNQLLGPFLAARIMHPIGMYAEPRSWRFNIFRLGGMVLTIAVLFGCAMQIIKLFWFESFLAGLNVQSWPIAAQLPFQILIHTPWWVFPAFAFILRSGIQALKPRTLSIGQLMIVPFIFIAWGVVSLIMRSTSSPILLVSWSIAAASFAAIAWVTGLRDGVGFDRNRKRISLPGSRVPLIRSLLIFTAKYGLGTAFALAPESRNSIELLNIIVSGASAGYFAGWAVRLILSYQQAAPQNSSISEIGN